MAEAGFDAPANLPEEAGIPDRIIKHEMNGEDMAAAEIAENGDNPLSSTLNENGDGVREGLGFLYEDDSSDEEATVTIGTIQKNLPFQKGTMASKDKIDMDGQPTINGTMIYDLDLATMEDKPWQKPGADITDYFNYGFNEETWNSYCERQRKLRAEYGTQKEVNRAITNSININFNPQQSQQQSSLNVMNQSGRQLINVVGPDKPQKAKVFDLTKPPPAIMKLGTPQIPVLGSQQNAPEIDEESPSPTSTSTVPIFNAFVPPPNFNPNVPPPGLISSNASTLPSVNMNMPPPVFNQQAPMYAFAGFNNNQAQPQQFGSGGAPQPLLGNDYSSTSFEKNDSRERTQDDNISENSGDEYSRRKRRRRSRSGSQRRRKDDKVRDYRDKSSSSRSRRRDDHREKRRDRDDDYEKDRKRRKHDRIDRSERTSSKKYEDTRGDDSDAPPGID